MSHPAAGWQRSVTTAGRHWGLGLFTGAVTVLLGIAALVWPRASLLLVAVLFAISLLTNGIALLIMALADGESAGNRRVLLAILGALAFLAGALCLRAPQQTVAAIALLIGSWWIVSGALLVVAALTDPVAGGRALAAARGVLSLAGGLFLLLQPRISAHALIIILGIGLITLGLLLIADALQTRHRSNTPRR